MEGFNVSHYLGYKWYVCSLNKNFAYIYRSAHCFPDIPEMLFKCRKISSDNHYYNTYRGVQTGLGLCCPHMRERSLSSSLFKLTVFTLKCVTPSCSKISANLFFGLLMYSKTAGVETV